MLMRWVLMIAVVLGCTGLAGAQESPDQLRKERDDALIQLKRAQDGKNELYGQIQQLQTKLDEQAKQLEQIQAANDELVRQSMVFSEKTYFLTSQYAAWQAFMVRYPQVRKWWDIYLSASLTTNPDVPALDTLRDEWPFLPPAAPVIPATTQTAPATTPGPTTDVVPATQPTEK